MQEHWLSVEESAAHLGASRDTIYKWLVRMDVPAPNVARVWGFHTSEVDTRVRAGRTARIHPASRPLLTPRMASGSSTTTANVRWQFGVPPKENATVRLFVGKAEPSLVA